jgi:hypothetical protein
MTGVRKRARIADKFFYAIENHSPHAGFKKKSG